MNALIISIVVIAGILISSSYLLSQALAEEKPRSLSMMNMCGMMMNKAPKDVTISPVSSQLVQAGKEAKIIILIKDKITKQLLLEGIVPIMIERGPSMSTMEMVTPMFVAKEIGDGKYQITFTPHKKGVYTIHTHVIPPTKSMHPMMINHMDIGIIAK